MVNIDNIKLKLGDEIKRVIDNSSEIKICAAFFSIYAFSELKEELSKIKEFSFLFNSPTFFKDNSQVKSLKDKSYSLCSDLLQFLC